MRVIDCSLTQELIEIIENRDLVKVLYLVMLLYSMMQELMEATLYFKKQTILLLNQMFVYRITLGVHELESLLEELNDLVVFLLGCLVLMLVVIE